jgi:hypothetical protein
MKFEINFTLPDGTEDSIVVEGDTIEEVQMKATQEVAVRGGINPWSREVN